MITTFGNNLLNSSFKDFNNVRKCFVPAFKTVSENDVQLLQNFIDSSKKLAVLTGAGISTESGIPDYRSKDYGLYSRNRSNRPMNYSEFLGRHSSRQRYWARSFIGWNYIHNRQPNINHLTLSEWQKCGKLFCCITQNVDRLHHKAGTESVIELHGNLYDVICIDCNYRISRIFFQEILSNMNKDLLAGHSIQLSTIDFDKALRPDGDIGINGDFIRSFQIPYCERCNGILKPNVVFFGDNVPIDLVQHIYEKINQSDSLLVLGSSLKVYSSYRFILHSIKCKKPISIINIGETRADHLEGILKVDAKISDILTKIRV